jgi:Uma2 family endonuclease
MSIAEPPFDAKEGVRTDTHSDEPLFEVIDGLRVELLVSAQNTYLASRLVIRSGPLVDSRQLGHVVGEMLFDLPLVGRSRGRRPDVAFVSFERWPAGQPLPEHGEHWSVAPDLAVEFVSPNDEVEELLDKLRDYFESGVRQVWVVHPRARLVQVFHSLAEVHGFQEPAEVDGGPILPGIRVPVATMLPPRP